MEITMLPSLPRVKPEPIDYCINALDSTRWQAPPKVTACQRVKPEPVDSNAVPHASAAAPQQSASGLGSSSIPNDRPSALLCPTYASAQEIAYTPEKALQQGLSMIQTIRKDVQKLELGSRMRKEVWLREIAGLESQGSPTTLIAVCGATGAGKSSLLNAILDDNIVPTSGMRACTAVVTEIAYHGKPTIDADVSFLTQQEWKEELEVLLNDLIDEDRNLRRATDLRSEAGVAWHKVHAVYPTIDQDQLARMTADEIMLRHPKISKHLGTTKHICAKDSKAFAVQISKYVDSKNQRRNQKKGKNSKDEKKKEKKKDGGSKKNAATEITDDEPALWPLIRQVVVNCKAAALSTGAILVDLPGVADANAARSNIWKDYMKKCDCIWVLAPITRAVDDRTAKDLLGDAFKIQLKMDGNYDDSAITFVATKADDISCSEVIGALKLEDDEEIEEIEEKISAIKDDQKKWKTSKAAAQRAIKATEEELKEVCAMDAEYRKHLEAFKRGEFSLPVLTGKKLAVRKSRPPSTGKRKRSVSGNEETSKRRKGVSDDEGSDDGDGDDGDDVDELEEEAEEEEKEEEENDDDHEDEGAGDDDASNSDLSSLTSGSEDEGTSDSGSEEEVEDAMDTQEEVTEEFLKAKSEETASIIKSLWTRLNRERSDNKKAGDEMANAMDKLAKAQTEKNGICSRKRSEFSRDVLKEDFRTGLREIDDAAAQERNPDSFDPTQQLRNYDDIDLPTFCASARDYIRITKQVKGDGKPTCFTNVADTEIPDLQKWCQTLTVSSRQRAARVFLAHQQTFVTSVTNYVRGITEVKEEDRKALSELWESQIEENGDEENDEEDDFDPFYWLRQDAWNEAEDGVLHAKKKMAAKVNILGEPIGIISRLTKDFERVVENTVTELKSKFEDGLNEKLHIGATNAAAVAVKISDEFAASMHWATYRATLRRDGTFRRCLNTELIHPLTRHIASSWARVFEADLFASFEARAISIIVKLLKDVENSAAPVLKDRAKQQGEVALEEAKTAMKSLVTVVGDILNENQKEVSRCLAPHVQAQLRPGYCQAAQEQGRGSVARQKASFNTFIQTARNHVFNGGAETLLERLGKAADSIGEAIETALGDLSQKVEVSMSVLWERPHDDPRQARARRETLETLKIIDQQVGFWSSAEKLATRGITNGNYHYL